MARYFEISNSTPTIKLDSQGRGTVQYTVKNVSAAPTDGRAVLTSVPVTSPPSGAVQNGWVKIDPPIDHHYGKDEQNTYTVKVEVPQKDRTKTGSYTFRLDAMLVSIPDRGDEGPVTAFTVEAGKPDPKPNMLAWLIPLILFVLIGIGVGTWLLLRHPKQAGGKVPDLAGKTIGEAATALAAVKMTVDPKVETTAGNPADADKVVTQVPAAGEAAVDNASVHLTVGASRTTVPLLIGQTLESAQTILNKDHLSVGTVTNTANPNFAGGVVFSQSIPENESVITNTSINLSVTPKTVTVPSLTGKYLNVAIQQLKSSTLQLGDVYCDQLAQPIVNQSPAANTTVPVGTAVSVYVPCTIRFDPGVIYLNKETLAQRSIVAGALAHK